MKRITLPKELRKKLGISEQDRLEFYTEGDTIILALEGKNACVFCGCEKNLAKYSDKNICEKCLDNSCGIEFHEKAI